MPRVCTPGWSRHVITAVDERERDRRRPRVLAFTQSRTAARFVESLAQEVRVELFTTAASSAHLPASDSDAVVLMEIGSSEIEARALNATLESLHPALPQIGVVTSADALEAWHIRWLLTGALAGLLDMEVTPDEMRRVCAAVVHGAMMVHVRARAVRRTSLWPPPRTAVSGPVPRLTLDDEMLARLAARGESESELGRQIHLSTHTVHRKLERIRAQLGLRNRIELAAWCGAHGLYPS